MQNQQVFIHVGMPRCASTFLQREVFAKLDGFGFKNLEDSYYSKGFNQLQFADDSFYDENSVLSLIKGWQDDRLIISNENFIGQSTYFNHANRTMIANRLAGIYPEASIILVLRNQIDLLASLYTINLQGREIGSIDDFIWAPKRLNAGKMWGQGDAYFNTTFGFECLDGYDYNSLIKLYKRKFKNVHVLLFEEFVEDPEVFSDKLAAILKVDQKEISELIASGESMNNSVSEKQAKKLVRLNKYQEFFDSETIAGRGVQYMKRKVINKEMKGEKPMFSAEKKSFLKNHFSQLNRNLAEAIPDLHKYSKEYYID